MDFSSLFETSEEWQVFASGNAQGSLTPVTAPDGTLGVRLDYDFHGGGGFVVMRRAIPLTLPNTFEIGFQMRGKGPPNHFEFKVASPGGLNVWRHLRQDFPLPTTWTDFSFNERAFPFAWGPAGGGAPSEVEAVEIVIAAGPGGRGTLELSHASLEDQTLSLPHSVHASSHADGYPPEAAISPDLAGWRAAVDDESPCWAIDFRRSLRFGGLVIHWPDEWPTRCTVELSDDGEKWTLLREIPRALGKMSHISAHRAEARHLRIRFSNAASAAIRQIELKPDAFSTTPNEFLHAVAADFPRGWHPQYWHRVQSYWTPIGSPAGKRRALINEEGMVEVDEGGFSLEPFILIGSRILTWADVKTSCEMEEQGAPVPSVRWKAPRLRLEILPWVDGKRDKLTLHVTYRLKVTGRHAGMRLALAVRPFQVNPPWQAFRNLGGHSPITAVSCGKDEMRVNERRILTSPRPVAMGAATFAEGGVLGVLSQGAVPAAQTVEDETGLASAVMVWDLPANATSLEVTVSVPYFEEHAKLSGSSRDQAVASWQRRLSEVKWQVPNCAKPAFDCLRTAAGHILINRDGPAIQPGPRRYTRSWVRDCVIMGAALTKVGLPQALDEFICWYAQFQRDDGFVPCVVDRDGIDWLVEHDSHGQFLWGIREVFRETLDRKFLGTLFPHARLAAEFLIELRAQRMTKAYRSGEKSACFGLLPESASHEGYLAHPVHSYWDDFWGVRGLQAAADLAQVAGFPEDAKRWRKEADDFQRDLLSSLDQVIAAKNLNYIPGSVEWADFDPTATANAVGLLDFADALPAVPLEATLSTYLEGYRRRLDPEAHWNNYSAYEIRIIGACVRLGKRDIANELLDFFLQDRRPTAWNQWPEITWKDPRSPGHLGDVPHTWIAAEYILSLTSMVAAEREHDSSLVLASGIPWDWIRGLYSFSVKNLPTRYGPLHFRIHALSDKVIRVKIADTIAIPSGGLWLVPPTPAGKRIATADSKNRIQVHALPYKADLRLVPGNANVSGNANVLVGL